MRHVRLFMCVGLVAFAVACGGGDGASGVDSDKELRDLSASEWRDLCVWGIDLQGQPGEVIQCEGGTLELSTYDECAEDKAEYDDCTLTVADMETCVEAMAADPCSLGGDACAPIFECVFPQDS